MVRHEGLQALGVGGLVGLLHVGLALLGNVRLLKGLSKGRHRHILVLLLTLPVLLQPTVSSQPPSHTGLRLFACVLQKPTSYVSKYEYKQANSTS